MSIKERAIKGPIGYFIGRPNSEDELTIAFLGENDDAVGGLAALLKDIGPENLRVAVEPSFDGTMRVVVEDKRDPTNFNDCRRPPVDLITRFLDELDEDQVFVLTVGDYDLNMAYDKVKFDLDQVEVLTPKFLN